VSLLGLWRELEAATKDAAPSQADHREALIAGLHPKQQAFVLDKSQRKCALGGRRGGKTWAVAIWLLIDTRPGELSVFIARTTGHARRILWRTLRRVNDKYQLGYKFREDISTAEGPDGYRIWLTGAKDFSEVEKLRGDRYWKVGIDEAGSVPSALLKYLIDDIIDPALMDLDGELALIGTPGIVPSGTFFERSTGEGKSEQWPTHNYTCLDNPHVKGERYLKRKLKENNWTEDNPTYRREYLAQWVKDIEALVYPYLSAVNKANEIPRLDYIAVAIDFGATQAKPTTAFTVGGIQRGRRETWILRSFKVAGMIPSSIAGLAEQLLREHGAKMLVVDEGALGRGYAQEMRISYNLPVMAAEKSKKRAFQELFGGNLRAGIVKVVESECQDLLDEWEVGQWLEDRSEEDPSYEWHCADTAIYLERYLRAHYDHRNDLPELSEADKQRAEMAAAKDKARAEMQRQNRGKSKELHRKYAGR